jgi:protein-tyrosine phosphatase
MGQDDLGINNVEKALEALIEPGAMPVLIHCTQGKDRTGMIAILVLLILNVPLEAIELDYGLSDEALLPEAESRLAEIRELGLPDSFGETDPGLPKKTVQHLDSQYGGLDVYLDSIGFDLTKRNELRELLSF